MDKKRPVRGEDAAEVHRQRLNPHDVIVCLEEEVEEVEDSQLQGVVEAASHRVGGTAFLGTKLGISKIKKKMEDATQT